MSDVYDRRGGTAAIILAGGGSARFGPSSKLLTPLAGVTVAGATVRAAEETAVDKIVVVTGHEARSVESAVITATKSPGRVRFVFNPDHGSGMGSSIACGVGGVERDFAVVLIWPGDMPLIRPESVDLIIRRSADDAIVAPVFGGRRGHPVCFGRVFFDELARLEGDVGARPVVERHPDSLIEVDVEDPGVVFDIDTEDDLETARRLLAGEKSDA